MNGNYGQKAKKHTHKIWIVKMEKKQPSQSTHTLNNERKNKKKISLSISV